MGKKYITFEYDSTHFDVYPRVVSTAKSNIPKWFKETQAWEGDYPPKVAVGAPGGKTVKKCMPFLDALTTGYMLITAYDIVISLDESESPVFSWANGGSLIEVRPKEQHRTIPTPAGHYDIPFIWNVPANIRVPNGYVSLVTHPLNRFDLPFTTMSGVVDGGFVLYETGKLPFYLKQNFTGVLPQGTPFAQIIPFKADSWKSKRVTSLIEEGKTIKNRSLAVIENWYKNSIWKRKEYL